MKTIYSWQGNNNMLQRLHSLPRKMAGVKNNHNIAEFVLHELCQKECFDIPRAAYFVDNPDYDCMKGVAGYCTQEQFDKDIWSCPLDFSDFMCKANFNNAVRSFQRHSCHRHQEPLEDTAVHIAEQLGLHDVNCCVIPMPHDNHGILVYEKQVEDEHDKECLLNGATLLSFCPIY